MGQSNSGRPTPPPTITLPVAAIHQLLAYRGDPPPKVRACGWPRELRLRSARYRVGPPRKGDR